MRRRAPMRRRGTGGARIRPYGSGTSVDRRAGSGRYGSARGNVQSDGRARSGATTTTGRGARGERAAPGRKRRRPRAGDGGDRPGSASTCPRAQGHEYRHRPRADVGTSHLGLGDAAGHHPRAARSTTSARGPPLCRRAVELAPAPCRGDERVDRVRPTGRLRTRPRCAGAHARRHDRPASPGRAAGWSDRSAFFAGRASGGTTSRR